MAFAFLNGLQYVSDETTGNIGFLVNRNIVELDIPSGITRIGNSAFRGCTRLKKVTIPDTITHIDYNAFTSCSSLEEIKLPDGVRIIMDGAFMRCGSIKELTIPSGETVLRGTICQDCGKLKSFTALGRITSVNSSAFSRCYECLIYDLSHCDVCPTLTNVNAFEKINKNAKIFVPNSLYRNWKEATNWVSVADHIFPGPSEGLEYEYYSDEDGYMVKGVGSFEGDLLVIPESYDGPMGEKAVVGISADDFVNNDQITFLYMPESAKYIHGPCFDSCAKLEKVYIPGVRGIPSFEFLNLSSLQYVEFGKNINYIGGGAFGGSRDVVFDFSRAETVPELYSYGAGMEFGENPTIIVPSALLQSWKNSTNWAIYADQIIAAE